MVLRLRFALDWLGAPLTAKQRATRQMLKTLGLGNVAAVTLAAMTKVKTNV